MVPTHVLSRKPATRLQLLLALALTLPKPGHSNAFLGRSPAGHTGAAQQQREILAQLEVEARLGRLEEALRGTFQALPKGAQGRLGAPAARYALRRLFMRLHGWQVRGLEPDGAALTEASPAAALGGRVPSDVVELFEDRLGRHGLDLHELAVLASTMEGLIHGEAIQRLQTAHTVLGFDLDGDGLNLPQASRVMETYLVFYLTGINVTKHDTGRLMYVIERIHTYYPNWPEAVKFLHRVRENVAPSIDKFGFSSLTAVVEEASAQFGQWQDQECRELKDDLLAIEEANGTGRARLADFYGAQINDGKWQFRENVESLRQLGALDETDPAVPRVIIPNYINGQSNCLGSSAFYRVCCIDECEQMLGQLEQQLGRPTASPEEIMAAALADLHGGMVPLHGRLFAQWLHLAYPRECPYPHVTGTFRSQAEKEWGEEAGRAPAASRAEMAVLMEASRKAENASVTDVEGLCSSMWTMEEE
eukprot:CAMPEP_0168403962 /NCGR_PEP_ID=MMETSP0228-20121227/24396_1 /TAXON_ID=133427 /ORGANISM="Protoceratium reticulatum, Strain CCCM 535 (=CCMP 1889)" /LENGTH=476 /DNA_ID=CAMNT_0008417575 /DNA_START=52 /DNA_END=1480 /DNA_ORIENTATION=+